MRRAVGVLVAGLALSAATPALGAAKPFGNLFITAAPRSDRVSPAVAVTPSFHESSIDCTASGDPAANVQLDCDTILPNNEPHIVVDPANPLHAVASSNDYDTCCDGFYTTFDGGHTWTEGNMSAEDETRTGSDPVTSFDVKHGVVLHSSLNFVLDEAGIAHDGDVVVSPSNDGGVTWGQPVVVDGGVGDELTGIFNDKEWIATDNNPSSPFYGRTYVTWTAFKSNEGETRRSPIFEAHSDDGGQTWSTPQEISGRNPHYCTFQGSGPGGKCDEDQFSTIAIGPDGTVSVAFENSQNAAAWEAGDQFENQILLVRSSDGGATWSRPQHVVDLEDGTRDYPTNVNGRQTLSGFQFRVNSAGNVTADPHTGALYITFSDNRAGQHDVADPQTDTNVYVMHSTDGVSWDGPVAVSSNRGEQWFPFGAVDPTTGQFGVIYNDTFRAGSKHYGTTLARWNGAGFSTQRISTALSSPDAALFFQAGIPGCRRCATFIGDYNGFDYGSDGTGHAVWTDMRVKYLNGRGRSFNHLQFIDYTQTP